MRKPIYWTLTITVICAMGYWDFFVELMQTHIQNEILMWGVFRICKKQQLCHDYSKQTLMQTLCCSHIVLSSHWNENTHISSSCGRNTADMCLFSACQCTRGPTASPHCVLEETWADRTRKPWATTSSFFNSAETGPWQWQSRCCTLFWATFAEPWITLAWGSPWQLSSKSPLGLRGGQGASTNTQDCDPLEMCLNLRELQPRWKQKIPEIFFFTRAKYSLH